jgi:hypothetical protein
MSADRQNEQPRITPEIWRPSSKGSRRAPALPRERPRQLALLGCLAVIVGMLIQPYATGSEFEGTTTRIWISEVSDAGLAILLSLVLGALVLSRGAAESRLRAVQIAPVVLAAMILAIVAQILRQLLRAIDGWLSGSLGPGPLLAGVGAVLAIVGTGWVLLRKWPATGGSERVPAVKAVPTEPVGSGTPSEAIGVLVGGAIGLIVAIGLVAPAVPAGIPLGNLIAILAGTIGGVWLGSMLGRRLGLG